jgi:hypothetical protein
LKWYDGGGENRITSKRIFEVEVFFSSQNIDSPFYLKRGTWSFLFFSLFFMLCLLRTWGLMIFEDKIISSKTSFQIASIY